MASSPAIGRRSSHVGREAVTITLRALSAVEVVSRSFGGKPWVGKDTPVSSLDPAVTLAVAALS